MEENRGVLPLSWWISSPDDALDTYWMWTCRDEGLMQGVVGRGCWGERCTVRVSLQAGPQCIPSACVQPKCLMKSESAAKTEHFYKNNALSFILLSHSTYPPLFIPLLAFPQVIHVMTGAVVQLFLWPWSGSLCRQQPIPISHSWVSVNSAPRVHN